MSEPGEQEGYDRFTVDYDGLVLGINIGLSPFSPYDWRVTIEVTLSMPSTEERINYNKEHFGVLSKFLNYIHGEPARAGYDYQIRAYASYDDARAAYHSHRFSLVQLGARNLRELFTD